MKDKLIDFETAILAHEKGFKFHGTWEWIKLVSNSSKVDEYLPTQSLLQKWLREIHKIIIIALPYSREYVSIPTNIEYIWMIYRVKSSTAYDKVYNTYEEALEEGLKEALSLIK
jgi:hypothetical protein